MPSNNDHDEHAGGQDVQRRQALVHQHLVDDDLTEERGRHGEDLDDEGRDEDFRKNLAVLPDGGAEPQEIERPVGVVQAQPGLDEDQPAGPDIVEAFFTEEKRSGLARVPKHGALAVETHQDRKAAVFHFQDRRQRGLVQPIPGASRWLRGETDLLGGEKDFVCTDGATLEAQGAQQLRRVRAQLVKAGNDGQGLQAGERAAVPGVRDFRWGFRGDVVLFCLFFF